MEMTDIAEPDDDDDEYLSVVGHDGVVQAQSSSPSSSITRRDDGDT